MLNTVLFNDHFSTRENKDFLLDMAKSAAGESGWRPPECGDMKSGGGPVMRTLMLSESTGQTLNDQLSSLLQLVGSRLAQRWRTRDSQSPATELVTVGSPTLAAQ